jgi:hypothetical protein
MTKYKINWTDISDKNKKCKRNVDWEIKEAGEVSHVFEKKSGMDALREYKKKYGKITSKIVNISHLRGECLK